MENFLYDILQNIKKQEIFPVRWTKQRHITRMNGDPVTFQLELDLETKYRTTVTINTFDQEFINEFLKAVEL